MELTSFTKAIDAGLRPLGFHRKKLTWNRKAGEYVDVVTLEASKAGDMLTVDLGVANTSLFTLCWGRDFPGTVQPIDCTVRQRLRDRATGAERWWDRDMESAPGDISTAINLDAVPFFDQMRTPQAMEQFLAEEEVDRKPYPLPRIYSVLIRVLEGRREESCEGLRAMLASVPDAWRQRITDVMGRLGC